MKNSNKTLQALGQGRPTVTPSLVAALNSLLEQFLGCPFSPYQSIGLLLAGPLITAAILLTSVSADMYGWSAFFALAGIVASFPGLKQIYQH